MKKVSITALITTAICSSLYANDGIELNNGYKVDGDVRVGYVKYDVDNLIDSYGTYFSSKISLTTPTTNNFFVKTTVAGVTDFGINNPNYEDRNLVFDGNEKSSFAMLQELFINYSNKSNTFKIGRQELVTPLVEADDGYFLANSFDAIDYTNNAINNYTFHLGYFYQMAGVWDSGANGTEFHSMSDASFVDERDKKNANNSGMFYGAVEYKNDKHQLKIWDYYTKDLYNMFFLEYTFADSSDNFSYETGFEVVNFKEVGDLASNNYTNINYSLYSAKFDGSLNNGISFSTGATKYTNGEGTGATLGAWGGFPSYTYGFAYSFFDVASLRDATIYKLQLSYDLGKLGLDDTTLTYRYTNYNLNSSYSDSQDYMRLNGVKLTYSSSNGSSLKMIYEDRDLDKAEDAFAIRIIAGYKF